MISKARADTPKQLRARNIVLAEHDLWRHVAESRTVTSCSCTRAFSF